MCRATTCHRASVPVIRGQLFHPAGDGVDSVSAAVGAENLGRAIPGCRGMRPAGCTRIRRSTAAASDPRPVSDWPTDSTESTRLGASSGRSWAAGRRRSMTSSTRRRAASAKTAAWRIDGDMTSGAVAARGCAIAALAGRTRSTAPQRRVRRLPALRDVSTLRVVVGDGLDGEGVATGGAHAGCGQRALSNASVERGACRRVADECCAPVIIAQIGLARTRAAKGPSWTVTVGATTSVDATNR